MVSDPAQKAEKHRFVVGQLAKKIRLDAWLAKQDLDLSRNRIQQLISSGHVMLAGQEVRDTSLQLKPQIHIGTQIDVVIPPTEPSHFVAEDIPLDIHFEDEDLIVLNKQAGLVVHPAPGHETGTLVNALLKHCGPNFFSVGGVDRPGIVHRLDKDTSGLIVVAKTEQTLTQLQEQFAARTIKRAYIAIVAGVPNPSSGTVNAPIGRHPKDRKRMAVEPKNGKIAITGYKLQQPFGLTASAIECRLKTGRTHQIRVHMHSIGHPLIGDPVYGPKRTSLYPVFSRQALHARELGFVHPATGRDHLFQADVPQDMENLIKELQKSEKTA